MSAQQLLGVVLVGVLTVVASLVVASLMRNFNWSPGRRYRHIGRHRPESAVGSAAQQTREGLQ